MPRTDTTARLVPGTPEQVYTALLDPDALVSWLPPGDMTATLEHFDPRPGGSYRMTLTHPEGRSGLGKTTDRADVVDVRFVELDPAVRVVQEVGFVSDDPAFTGMMTMTWDLTAAGGGTRVLLRADNVPDGVSVDDHIAGMDASLQQLATYLGG
jgi:uncharacterized protein YndB with AHSA1/START domain